MLRALNDKIIIKPLNSETVTAGGIIIPGSAVEKARIGIIAAVGLGSINSLGHFVPTELHVGMKVAFPHHAGNEIKHEEVNYLVLREDEILGAFEGEE